MELKELAERFLAQCLNESTEYIEADVSGWLKEVEDKLRVSFPPSFRALYQNFMFTSFDCGSIRFLGNMSDRGYEDISGYLERDKTIDRITTTNGFIHFAKAGDGSYDPICFNIKKKRNAEFEVVRLDHEAILLNEKIIISKFIATSLNTFMQDCIAKLDK